MRQPNGTVRLVGHSDAVPNHSALGFNADPVVDGVVLTVVIHVVGLGVVSQIAVHAYSRMIEHRHPTAVLVVVMGVTTLLAICLHA